MAIISKFPSAVSQTAIGGRTSWATPANITTTDNNRATVSLVQNSTSQTLTATGFGFAIPAGATIDSVTATYVATLGATSTFVSATIQLTVNGSVVGSTQSISNTGYLSTTATTANFNAALTADQVNNSTFGIALYASTGNANNVNPSATAQFDSVALNVTYTAPAGVIVAPDTPAVVTFTQTIQAPKANASVQPDSLSSNETGFAPQALYNQRLDVDTLNFSMLGNAPSTSTSDIVQMPAGNISHNLQAPSVNTSVQVSVGQFTSTGNAVVVSQLMRDVIAVPALGFQEKLQNTTIVVPAALVSSGFKAPANAFSYDVDTSRTIKWTNPQNALSSDSVYATQTASSVSSGNQHLVVTLAPSQFNVPDNSTIEEIWFSIKAYAPFNNGYVMASYGVSWTAAGPATTTLPSVMRTHYQLDTSSTAPSRIDYATPAQLGLTGSLTGAALKAKQQFDFYLLLGGAGGVSGSAYVDQITVQIKHRAQPQTSLAIDPVDHLAIAPELITTEYLITPKTASLMYAPLLNYTEARNVPAVQTVLHMPVSTAMEILNAPNVNANIRPDLGYFYTSGGIAKVKAVLKPDFMLSTETLQAPKVNASVRPSSLSYAETGFEASTRYWYGIASEPMMFASGTQHLDRALYSQAGAMTVGAGDVHKNRAYSSASTRMTLASDNVAKNHTHPAGSGALQFQSINVIRDYVYEPTTTLMQFDSEKPWFNMVWADETALVITSPRVNATAQFNVTTVDTKLSPVSVTPVLDYHVNETSWLLIGSDVIGFNTTFDVASVQIVVTPQKVDRLRSFDPSLAQMILSTPDVDRLRSFDVAQKDLKLNSDHIAMNRTVDPSARDLKLNPEAVNAHAEWFSGTAELAIASEKPANNQVFDVSDVGMMLTEYNVDRNLMFDTARTRMNIDAPRVGVDGIWRYLYITNVKHKIERINGQYRFVQVKTRAQVLMRKVHFVKLGHKVHRIKLQP